MVNQPKIEAKVVVFTHKDPMSIFIMSQQFLEKKFTSVKVFQYQGNKPLESSDISRIKESINSEKADLVFLEANLGNSSSEVSSFKTDFFESFGGDVYFALFSQAKIQDEDANLIKNMKNVLGFFGLISQPEQDRIVELFNQKKLDEFKNILVPDLKEMGSLAEKSGNNEKQKLPTQNSETDETDKTDETDEHPEEGGPSKMANYKFPRI